MRRFGGLLAFAFVLLLGACDGDDDLGKFEVFVGGENEVCDAGGSCGGPGIGQASLDIDPEAGRLCYDLELEDIPGSTAAHIHSGALQQTGDVVVDLEWEPGASSGSKCLEDLDEGLLTDVVESPRLYYVNVHSERYPEGAARGHLTT